MNYYKVLCIFLMLGILSSTGLAQEFTKDEALAELEKAEQDMRDMQASGFGTEAVEDLLIQAKLTLEKADLVQLLSENITEFVATKTRKSLEGLNYEKFTYQKVVEIAQEIAQKEQQAFETSDAIQALDEIINSLNKKKSKNMVTGMTIVTRDLVVDTKKTEELLSLARKELIEERYESAQEHFKQAQAEFEAKQAEVTTLNLLVRSSKNFLLRNITILFLLIPLMIVGRVFIGRMYGVWKSKKILEELKQEKKSLVELMKRAQNERFEEGTIPEFVYQIRMEAYSKRLHEVKEEIPVIRARLKNKGKA